MTMMTMMSDDNCIEIYILCQGMTLATVMTWEEEDPGMEGEDLRDQGLSLLLHRGDSLKLLLKLVRSLAGR